MGLGHSGWKWVEWVSPWTEAQTWIQSFEQWKQHFHVPAVLAETKKGLPAQHHQEYLEKILIKDLGEAGSPQDLIVSQNSPVTIPHRPSSKRKILTSLRKKEKNKDGNEKCKCFQILAGIHCKCFCSRSPQPCLSLKEEKKLLLRHLKLILFSFVWEDRSWFLWNYFILIVYVKICLAFRMVQI